MQGAKLAANTCPITGSLLGQHRHSRRMEDEDAIAVIRSVEAFGLRLSVPSCPKPRQTLVQTRFRHWPLEFGGSMPCPCSSCHTVAVSSSGQGSVIVSVPCLRCRAPCAVWACCALDKSFYR